MRAGARRHRATLMRPPPHMGQKGDTAGKDQIILPDWPCHVRTMTGRELEVAMQMTAVADLAVECYGDPKKPIKEKDYWEFEDGTRGKRRLNVMAVIDEQQNGVKLKLLCGEERS